MPTEKPGYLHLNPSQSIGSSSDRRGGATVVAADEEDAAMNAELAKEAARAYSESSGSDVEDDYTRSMKLQRSLLLSEAY